MKRGLLFGSVVLLGGLLGDASSVFYSQAEAKTHHTDGSTPNNTARKTIATSTKAKATHAVAFGTSNSTHRRSKLVNLKGGKVRYGYYRGGLQCVPFARAASGIGLKGNAANWWDAAAGVYERGSLPETGSVLNFRSTGGMRLGHVAVVTAVRDSRSIEIEHANWSKGSVSRHVSVVDVSPDNDWSQVRVAMGRSGEYGRTYPTYGFIYDRPDSGTMLANTGAGSVPQATFEEVAEMPTSRTRVSGQLDLNVPYQNVR